MFELNPDKRINFAEIRVHPLFIKFFGVASVASQSLYSKRFMSRLNSKQNFPGASRAIETTKSSRMATTSKFPVEEKKLKIMKDKAEFLRENGKNFIDTDFISPVTRDFLILNFYRYYVIELEIVLK